MVHYLLNATIIWLLGLLLFDLLLRRHPGHKANRIWLLSALLLGALLPAFPWQQYALPDNTPANQPLYILTRTRQTIETGITPDSTGSGPDWSLLALCTYMAGALFNLALVLREAMLLVRYYRKGRKHRDGNVTVIETGQRHGPFSLLHYVFVGNKDQYSTSGWQMILQHEQAHGKLLHFADMLLLQVLQIVFWFHPLVYLYRGRLLMVHEYQADAFVIAERSTYGSFLVEQSMLRGTPALSHSFSYSPIKNRIRMLTHNQSSRFGQLRYLLTVPFLFVAVALCSQSFSQITQEEKLGDNKVRFKGNIIEFSPERVDTIITVDPVTNAERMMVMKAEGYPLTVNGEKIYEELETPGRAALKSNEDWQEDLFRTIREDLKQLPDGLYTPGIFNTIIDKNGQIAYYRVRGLSSAGNVPFGQDNPPPVIDDAVKKKIDAKVAVYLDRGKSFTPAAVRGNAVPVQIEFRKFFLVKDHNVTLYKR